MHDLLAVHFLEPQEYGMQDSSGLVRFEFVFGLHLVVKLPSFQQLHHDVQGILRFEDLVQLHAALVVQCSHYLNLLYQALFPLVFAVGCLFRKGLYRKASPSLQLLGQVNRSEISLPDFLLWLELLVKPSLIHFSLQNLSTGFEVSLRPQSVNNLFFLLLELQRYGGSCEGVLEVEVEVNSLFFFRSMLDQAVLKELEGGITLGGMAGL